MTVQKVPFVVNFRKNKNLNSSSYGMYYPEADTKKTLGLKGFARHLVEHGKRTDYGECVLFLQNVVDCLVELMCQNQPVKLDGLGIFTPSIKAVKGGAQTLQLAIDTMPDNIEGVKINFRGEGSGEDDEKLTSKAIKERCTFTAGYVVESALDSQNKPYQKKMSIATKQNEQQNDNGGGGGSNGGGGN